MIHSGFALKHFSDTKVLQCKINIFIYINKLMEKTLRKVI